jgi:phenylalanyl-tRNA synthetase alpha chain
VSGETVIHEDVALEAAVAAALEAVRAASTTAELKAARIAHTGEASALARLNATIRSLPPAEKPAAGKRIGEARAAVNAAIAGREAELAEVEQAARLAAERVDVTAAAVRVRPGARHPLALLRERVEDVFVGMGWEIVEGPELESEWLNFDALNIDPDHPARSPQDTFFVEPAGSHLVLRTQTSPVQVRVMQEGEPPIYVVAPGVVYRRDDIDATHSPMFHQMEGLAVDEGLTLAHLKGTMLHFFRELLGADREILLQPHFFPFTEPSVDVQVSYVDKAGRSSWLELAGAGMVDPNVLEACGIDSERHTGFAFGCGLDRIAMIRFGVPDLRLFFENDLRFLEQFA